MTFDPDDPIGTERTGGLSRGQKIGAAVALFAIVDVLAGVGLLGVFGVFAVKDGGGKPSLAEQMNRACDGRPGFHMADWQVGTEFQPLPPNVVIVTCEANRLGETGLRDTFRVAVNR